MKILNIHGYHGSPRNSAYQALEALGCEIIAPVLDYDNTSPENILGSLKYILADKRPVRSSRYARQSVSDVLSHL